MIVGLYQVSFYFDNGQPIYQDYLDPKGLWRFREHLNEGGRVEVNPIFGYCFKQLHYADISQLIAEYFDKYLQKQQKKQDVFIILLIPIMTNFSSVVYQVILLKF